MKSLIFNSIRSVYILFVTLTALPISFLFIIGGILSKYFDAYSDVSILASKIPFLFGQIVRYYYYKATLKHLGKRVIFKYGSFCQYHSASIGDRVIIGYYNAIGEVHMGNDIVVGGFVNLISGTKQHSFADPTKTIYAQISSGRSLITIGSDVWIGSNSVIMANIGTRCVIGAGSVLVRAADDNSVYAGNPAKLIKQIPPAVK